MNKQLIKLIKNCEENVVVETDKQTYILRNDEGNYILEIIVDGENEIIDRHFQIECLNSKEKAISKLLKTYNLVW